MFTEGRTVCMQHSRPVGSTSSACMLGDQFGHENRFFPTRQLRHPSVISAPRTGSVTCQHPLASLSALCDWWYPRLRRLLCRISANSGCLVPRANLPASSNPTFIPSDWLRECFFLLNPEWDIRICQTMTCDETFSAFSLRRRNIKERCSLITIVGRYHCSTLQFQPTLTALLPENFFPSYEQIQCCRRQLTPSSSSSPSHYLRYASLCLSGLLHWCAARSPRNLCRDKQRPFWIHFSGDWRYPERHVVRSQGSQEARRLGLFCCKVSHWFYIRS